MLSLKSGSSVSELLDLVRAYAKQETVGELKGTGRWLAWGAVGGISLLLGLLFVLVGVLRLLQSTWFNSANGSSFVPYFIVIALTFGLVIFSKSRILKPFLRRNEG